MSGTVGELKTIVAEGAKRITIGCVKWSIVGLVVAAASTYTVHSACLTSPHWTWGSPRGYALFAIHFAAYSLAFCYIGFARGVGHTARFIALTRGWAQVLLDKILDRTQRALNKGDSEPVSPSDLREALREAHNSISRNDEGQASGGNPVARILRSFILDKVGTVVLAALVTASVKQRDISIPEIRAAASDILASTLEGLISKTVLTQTVAPIFILALISVAVSYALYK